jgi:hypothetical protein
MRIILRLRGITVNRRATLKNAVEDETLQFVRQLHARRLEQYGQDHHETRLAAAYLGLKRPGR